MVLPPPCRGSNANHLHTARSEASCPRTVSHGLRLGTLLKKNEHRMVPNPNFLLFHPWHSVSSLFMQSSMIVLQSNIHAFKHRTAKWICVWEAWCKAADPVIFPISRTITFSDRLVILFIGTWEPTFSVPTSQCNLINLEMLWGPGGKDCSLTSSPLLKILVRKSMSSVVGFNDYPSSINALVLGCQ